MPGKVTVPIRMEGDFSLFSTDSLYDWIWLSHTEFRFQSEMFEQY